MPSLEDISVLAGLVGAAGAGVVGALRAAAWVGAWLERRKEKERGWSAQETRIGALTDRTQAAISAIEREVDHISRDLTQHMKDDSQRFLEISEQFGDVKSSLARIEGALGINR